MKKIAVLCILCLASTACGPKEPGQGMAYDDGGKGVDATAADQMRLPMTGANNTEKILYYYNRPDVMEGMQSWRKNWFYKKMGIKPSPEDPAYRETPMQKSPFRQ